MPQGAACSAPGVGFSQGVALAGYGGGLRPVGAPYGRVLGTHGRPVTGVYWWASKGGRILRAVSMVGRVAPWHDIA